MLQYPHIDSALPLAEQISQLKTYLYRLTDELNYRLGLNSVSTTAISGDSAIQEGLAADEVVEYNETTDGWTYRQWESGIAEAWIKFSTTSSSVGINFPSGLFVYVPLVQAAFNGTVNDNGIFNSYGVRITSISNTSISVSLGSVTSVKGEIWLYAIGRWKTKKEEE